MQFTLLKTAENGSVLCWLFWFLAWNSDCPFFYYYCTPTPKLKCGTFMLVCEDKKFE